MKITANIEHKIWMMSIIGQSLTPVTQNAHRLIAAEISIDKTITKDTIQFQYPPKHINESINCPYNQFFKAYKCFTKPEQKIFN